MSRGDAGSGTAGAVARRALPAAATFAGCIALWQLAVVSLGIREYLLPTPLAVLQAMASSEIPWTKHIAVTAIEILGAFLIAGLGGVLLGAAIAWSDVLSRALTPLLVFINTLPKVAVAPLFLIWVGYGILPNMLIGALIGFFPVVINTAVGLAEIDPDLLDLGRVFRAPKWKVFAKIRLPNAYPYVLGALKVTATSAVVGAVVGEFVASQAGLGYVIIATQSSMNTPVAFAALAFISLLGLALFAFVGILSRALVPWSEVADL